MAEPDTNGDGLSLLRRWTVIVLLTLLVIDSIAEVLDAWFFGDVFHTDPAFYALVGGMVSGLFVTEGLAILRRHRDE